MKRWPISRSRIQSILAYESDSISLAEHCRNEEITEYTFLRWRATYGEGDPFYSRRILQLEHENAILRASLAREMAASAVYKECE